MAYFTPYTVTLLCHWAIVAPSIGDGRRRIASSDILYHMYHEGKYGGGRLPS